MTADDARTFPQVAARHGDPNDAIQSLARIAAAAARLMAEMHYSGRPVDRNEEIDHMRANLDHVAREVNR